MTLFGGIISVSGIAFLMFCIGLISAIGYAIGRITIKGVALGTAGVFIIALVFGCFFYSAVEAQLTVKLNGETVSYVSNAFKIIENIGLALFVTAVGFIAGPKFFGNFKRNFKSYVLLGLVIIIVGGLVAAGCIIIGRATGENDHNQFTAIVVGLLSGALTSTPAFSAAKASVGAEYEAAVAVGYGIAYLFGVIGVVLFVQLIPKFVHADMEKERKLAGGVADGAEEEKKQEGKYIKLDDFSFLPFFLTVGLGVLVGAIKIPLSGQGFAGTCFSLTTTGGCLLVALILGHFGHFGKITIMPTLATLKVFRELGLMLFLIGAGVAGGASFVKYFKPIYFIYGIFMTLLPMIVGYFFAKYVLKLSLLNNIGSITGGMTSTPALGTLIRIAKSEDVAAAYAATYPIALISVVLVAQLLTVIF